MKAVVVQEFGGPEVLRVREVPEPHAGVGEVRIRVHSAPVTPGDALMRSGAYPFAVAKAPYIFGMDVGGVIDEIGEGSDTGLRVGDRVISPLRPDSEYGGGYAEYVVTPASWPVPVPSSWSDVGLTEASTLSMNGLTARHALDLLALSPGDTVAITGAAGAVGGFAVQLAKADGLHVVADASPTDEALVTSLGADIVVPRGSDVARQVLRTVPTGVRGAVDAALIGASLSEAILDGGRIAAVRPDATDLPRGITRENVFAPAYYGTPHLQKLTRQVEDGKLTLRVAQTYAPEHASEAHHRIESGGTRGRLVIVFGQAD
ncbi:zinc-binding alcohol dehydrogenase family protein [Streptomyces sp. NPDC051217]|uniref:zinc-binding alcohol dehydrogenase family protein n=1 Tax=Streptomyces sp. NPDC051217 TaxID=3365644 RepID=UPI00378BDC32